MAVNDNTIMSIFILTFIYLIIYRRNKFLGSIILFGAGMLMFTNSYIEPGYAFIIFITTLMNMLWEATTIFGFRKNNKNHLH